MTDGDSHHLVAGPRRWHRRSPACACLAVALAWLYGGDVTCAEALRLSRQEATSARGQGTYRLDVRSADGLLTIALVADGARLSEIAADLGRRLRAQVMLGPSLEHETLSLRISESLLEEALMSLAFRAFVDYEIRRDSSPRPLGIYLLGPTDPAPLSEAVVRGATQVLVLEGHTEDVEPAPDDDRLSVVGDKRFLTIASKKQPLAVVARAIGDVLGIPVDLRGGGAEPVEADIRNVPAEEAIPALSPNVRLYVRVDVGLSERTPLKLLVGRPDAE